MSKVMVELTEADALKHCLWIVQNGNIAILCNQTKPVAEVIPVSRQTSSGKKRKLGIYPQTIQMSDGFNDPDPELEKLFYEGAIFP